ncbi:hypothetical protein ALTERO38_51015 [Alteromonas sp. 38]|nr:hypothetical protein ALTER154_70197 [Alteromonas sp. 154]VXB57347.1 hypothetical protein ALTERO38_51015 [Alteromonas sp. 38]
MDDLPYYLIFTVDIKHLLLGNITRGRQLLKRHLPVTQKKAQSLLT